MLSKRLGMNGFVNEGNRNGVHRMLDAKKDHQVTKNKSLYTVIILVIMSSITILYCAISNQYSIVYFISHKNYNMIRISSMISIFKDDDDEGITPIGAALINSDIKSIEILLKSGVDVNLKFKYLGENGFEWISPLGYARKRNKKNIEDILLIYGAKE